MLTDSPNSFNGFGLLFLFYFVLLPIGVVVLGFILKPIIGKLTNGISKEKESAIKKVVLVIAIIGIIVLGYIITTFH